MRGESEIENNSHVNSRLLGDWEKITFIAGASWKRFDDKTKGDSVDALGCS